MTIANPDFLVVGAGFSGLTVALRLVEAGKSVVVLEKDPFVGGLAADFMLENGSNLERFYHHWFKSDTSINNLIIDLGLSEKVREFPSKTGMYFNKRIWKLSSPTDLLKFKALSFSSRVRLGFAILRVRQVKNWQDIEGLSIREWLEPLCGKEAYKIVWEPLITAKFSKHAEDVSAAWMWKKLVLRGGTRSRNGSESLMYIEGGFGELARVLAKRIKQLGGVIICSEEIVEIETLDDSIVEVQTSKGQTFSPIKMIFTGAPDELASLFRKEHNFNDWVMQLNSIAYLGNVCLVLVLDRSLSGTYWLNVNDPGFPFVGVIEHTNLVSKDEYGDLNVIYLSRYLDAEENDFKISDNDYFMNSINALKRMFPEFKDEWIIEHHIWRARNAQPITVKNYSKVIPQVQTPYRNLLFCSMVQIYPEDRGTNYAVKKAEDLVKQIILGKIETSK
jgi:protoporphyrinogen oxidase